MSTARIYLHRWQAQEDTANKQGGLTVRAIQAQNQQ
jgi:hypothetical protein